MVPAPRRRRRAPGRPNPGRGCGAAAGTPREPRSSWRPASCSWRECPGRISNAVGTCSSVLRSSSSGRSRKRMLITKISASGANGLPSRPRACAQFLRGTARGVLDDLGGFLRPTRARAEDHRVQHLDRARHAIALVDPVRGVAFGVHDHEHDALDGAWRQVVEGLVQGSAGDGVVDEAAHAEVVDEPAIDEVDVGPLLRVAIALGDLAKEARREVAVAAAIQAALRDGRAAARMVAQRHRAEQQRHGRRRGHGERQRHGVQVGTDQRELLRRELERRARGQVRGRDQQARPRAAPAQLAEGGAAEHGLQALLQHVAAPVPRRGEVVQRSPGRAPAGSIRSGSSPAGSRDRSVRRSRPRTPCNSSPGRCRRRRR